MKKIGLIEKENNKTNKRIELIGKDNKNYNQENKINEIEKQIKILEEFQIELIKQNNTLNNNTLTIHYGIKCENCKKNPINGIRYKCNDCDNYNLCELCRYLNSIQKFHPNNNFIIMREQKNEISKQLINIDNEDIINYNYECLTKNPTIEIVQGTKNVTYEFIIKCTNSLPWIKGTKLVCNKMYSNVIYYVIELL